MVAYLLGCFGLCRNKPFQPDTPPFSIQPYTTFEHNSQAAQAYAAKAARLLEQIGPNIRQGMSEAVSQQLGEITQGFTTEVTQLEQACRTLQHAAARLRETNQRVAWLWGIGGFLAGAIAMVVVMTRVI